MSWLEHKEGKKFDHKNNEWIVEDWYELEVYGEYRDERNDGDTVFGEMWLHFVDIAEIQEFIEYLQEEVRRVQSNPPPPKKEAHIPRNDNDRKVDIVGRT